MYSRSLPSHRQDVIDLNWFFFECCGSREESNPTPQFAYQLSTQLKLMPKHLSFLLFVIHHFCMELSCSNTKARNSCMLHVSCKRLLCRQSTFQKNRHCLLCFIGSLCTFRRYLDMVWITVESKTVGWVYFGIDTQQVCYVRCLNKALI